MIGRQREREKEKESTGVEGVKLPDSRYGEENKETGLQKDAICNRDI